MKNNKGFTLTEVLLAAMIVGIIGIALAALTTAAMRESGLGRTRTMLRHQLSVAISQMREDIKRSTCSVTNNDGAFVLTCNPVENVGPNVDANEITYRIAGGTLTRNVGDSTETLLSNLKVENTNYPSIQELQINNITVGYHIRLLVEAGGNGTPVVREAVDEMIRY